METVTDTHQCGFGLWVRSVAQGLVSGYTSEYCFLNISANPWGQIDTAKKVFWLERIKVTHPDKVLLTYICRHLERFKYIKDVIKLKNKACQESFAQGVIHPLESSTPSATRHGLSPAKQPPVGGMAQITSPSQSQITIKGGANTASLPRIAATSSSPETRWALSPRVSSLLKLPGSSNRLHVVDTIETRPRSHTNEEHVLSASDLGKLLSL